MRIMWSVEAEWVWIVWADGEEEGGDGVKELVEEPGVGDVACPAGSEGSEGSAGTWLAIATQPTVPGRSSGQASTGIISHLRMVLLRLPSLQGWGSRALPLTTECSFSPLKAKEELLRCYNKRWVSNMNFHF